MEYLIDTNNTLIINVFPFITYSILNNKRVQNNKIVPTITRTTIEKSTHKKGIIGASVKTYINNTIHESTFDLNTISLVIDLNSATL